MKRNGALETAVIAMAMTAALAPFAVAASLGSASNSLASGSSAVAQCDSDGVAIELNLSGTSIVSVTASGIAAECGGKTLSATVTGATSSGGSIAIPGGGGSATVVLTATVALVQSLSVDASVSGP